MQHSNQKMPPKAWVTLLTKPSYLPGCLVLAQSLRQVKSQYPLVLLVTSSLPASARQAIKHAGLMMREIDYIEPLGQWTTNTIDTRFRDTWTKLAAFGLQEFDRVVLMDSDMLVRRNMDELMTMELAPDHIAASHACTCNPRKLSHYPSDWIPETCPHTFAQGTRPVKASPALYPTHQLLNSGLVVIRPSVDLFNSMLARLHNDAIVATFVFPDQDFLALFFKDRWIPLGYHYNALKTLRTCHPDMWNDDDVANVHYILDKPWQSRPSIDNHDNLDVLTTWWWSAYNHIEREWTGRQELEYVQQYVAS